MSDGLRHINIQTPQRTLEFRIHQLEIFVQFISLVEKAIVWPRISHRQAFTPGTIRLLEVWRCGCDTSGMLNCLRQPSVVPAAAL